MFGEVWEIKTLACFAHDFKCIHISSKTPCSEQIPISDIVAAEENFELLITHCYVHSTSLSSDKVQGFSTDLTYFWKEVNGCLIVFCYICMYP